MTYPQSPSGMGLSWLAARRISYSRATLTRQLMTKKTKGIDLSQGGYTEAQFSAGLLLCQRQQLAAAEPVIRKGLS